MNKMILILKYIKYLLKSKSIYSTQSPFIYDFLSNVLNKETINLDVQKISALRNNLCKSKKKIVITDFGAGSLINKSKTRKIKDIAKNSAKNRKFGKLLYRITSYYKPKNIIELGTSLGISTLYLSKANKNANIFTFEGCPETAKIAKENFKLLNAKNIYITIGNFNQTLDSKLRKIKNIDLAFIDGNHQKTPTINYFKQCLKYSNNNTILIFDDIHWSKGMEEAWNYIKKHNNTKLTIDLFFIGIVFIKKELSKENYIIRF